MLLGVRTWLRLAGGLGIEPKLTASKAAVLPLDDPPINMHKETLPLLPYLVIIKNQIVPDGLMPFEALVWYILFDSSFLS